MRRGLPDALLAALWPGSRTGPGPQRGSPHGMTADVVAVAGFCGAVSDDLRAGDVVVASEVRGPEGVTACTCGPIVAALARLGIDRVRVGPVASVEHVVRGAPAWGAGRSGHRGRRHGVGLAGAGGGRKAVRRVARRARHSGSRDLPAADHSRGRCRGLADVAPGGARAGPLGAYRVTRRRPVVGPPESAVGRKAGIAASAARALGRGSS